MQDNAKIGLAALGGYALGRTKKAKAAIGLALWLTGRKYRLTDIGRDQLMNLLKSEEGQKLLTQLRGPVLAAGRSAALGLYENHAGRITEGLAGRTAHLIELAEGGSSKDADSGDADDSDAARNGSGGSKPKPRKSTSRRSSSSSGAGGNSSDDGDSDGAERLRKRRQSTSSASASSGSSARRPAKSTSGSSSSSTKSSSRQTRSTGSRSGSRSAAARSSK